MNEIAGSRGTHSECFSGENTLSISGTPLSALPNQPTTHCPRCGFCQGANEDSPELALYRPQHIKNRETVFAYVKSLSDETHEWLLALYVDSYLNLIAIETVARGGLSDVTANPGAILCRGRALGAQGFVLVHNHPSGDAAPSNADIAFTQRLRQTSAELDIPLLDHFIVAGGKMNVVGHW